MKSKLFLLDNQGRQNVSKILASSDKQMAVKRCQKAKTMPSLGIEPRIFSCHKIGTSETQYHYAKRATFNKYHT